MRVLFVQNFSFFNFFTVPVSNLSIDFLWKTFGLHCLVHTTLIKSEKGPYTLELIINPSIKQKLDCYREANKTYLPFFTQIDGIVNIYACKLCWVSKI